MKVQITLNDLDDLIYENDYRIADNYPDGMQEQHFSVDDAKFGKARMTVIKFNGVFINYGDISLKEDTRLKIKAEFPVLEMHFAFSGSSYSSAIEYPAGISFNKDQHNIMFIPSFDGKMEITSDEPLTLFEIGLSIPFFERIASKNSDISARMLDHVYTNKPTLLSRCHLCITPEMRMVISEIMNCKRSGYFKRLFLEAKVIELFMLQVEHMAHVNKKSTTKLLTSDFDKLHEAKQIMESRIDDPPSLVALSREVGLNDFKLKKGFKELFGNTVYGYLNDLRMNQAKHILQTQTISVTEVSSLIGYKHPTHFTAAFKRKYGINPRDVVNSKFVSD